MGWLAANLPLIGTLTLEHLAFALPPVVLGLVLAALATVRRDEAAA